MPLPMFDVSAVPEAVRARALTNGEADWLASLPVRLDEFAARWGLQLGEPFAGGTGALVLPAMLRDGSRAVLKYLVPGEEQALSAQALALRIARGRGCPELIDALEEEGVMLLEALGAPLADLEPDAHRQRQVLLGLLPQFWRCLDDAAPDVRARLPHVRDKGVWLAEFVQTTWQTLDSPCDVRIIDHALAALERRMKALDGQTMVLLHGDIHGANVLRADHGWKLIDPDGLVGPAEYDLGVLIREEAGDPEQLAQEVAAATGCDGEAVAQWAAIERVSTALVCLQLGFEAEGRAMLGVAKRLALS